MPQLRNRKGAVAILTVLLFLGLSILLAVVVEFSRMQMQRNQLQTAADASALAGAVQLIRNPRSDALDKAKEFGAYNQSLRTSVTVTDDDVEFGTWDPTTRTFTPRESYATADAVRVTLSRSANYLMGGAFGFASKGITVVAVAWAGAPVQETACMKPWAIPYTLLMERLNDYRGMGGAPNTRPMEPADFVALNEMSEAQRTFTLFLGQQGSQPDPGNFYAVQLPPYQYADGTMGDANPGANMYRNHLTGQTCERVSVGDVLLTQTGAMMGPTCGGVVGSNNCKLQGNLDDDRICKQMINGVCKDENGGDVLIKSAFWHQYSPKSQGQFTVEVAIVGSFILKQFNIEGTGNNERAKLTGVFQPINEMGPIGDVTTTLARPVLVR